ncbi:hypothetical protein KQX54_015255 [Cotesia glomerata]|uniref:Uncharacterized protein n=1 Tax=Cotesia glomerata TaxID=32391 RepID=A0AAV7IVZ6_COTGL|nr:hypothetical protein KQX54_015255 [Cotesia glomerata]
MPIEHGDDNQDCMAGGTKRNVDLADMAIEICTIVVIVIVMIGGLLLAVCIDILLFMSNTRRSFAEAKAGRLYTSILDISRHHGRSPHVSRVRDQLTNI